MFFLTPITEEKASDDIQQIYEDIKSVLGIAYVPLLFQYLANYPEYLAFIWVRMRENLQTSTFHVSLASIEEFAQKAIQEIYAPSPQSTTFIQKLHPQEKEHLSQTMQQLEDINTQLMILSIGVRESIKGLQVGVQKIQGYTNPWATNTQEPINTDTYFDKAHAMDTSEHALLAPLFGNNTIVTSHYQAFFSIVAKEMEHLVSTEAYLLTRVTLERQGLHAVAQFTVPFECSYQELMQMIGNRPHADELVHLLSVTFPSQFPRLVLTSAVMKQLLHTDNIESITNT